MSKKRDMTLIDLNGNEPLAVVARERLQQITREGFTPVRDVGRASELAAAAGCYLLYADAYPNPGQPPEAWPWEARWWKPKNWRRDFTRAGALVLAAIEAGDRQEGKAE